MACDFEISIPACWLLFLAYWFASASGTKVVLRRQNMLPSLAFRIPCVVGGILLWSPWMPAFLWVRLWPRATTRITLWVGAVVCACGLAFAIWARRALAGNWSSSITLKAGHSLIVTGPYRFSRHPIYTGILTMCLATPVQEGALPRWIGLALWWPVTG